MKFDVSRNSLIKLTKLAKLTNVHPSVFYIKVHQCVRYKLYARVDKVYSYVF